MTADDIIAALVANHADAIWATELAFDGGQRRADFWTISPNGSSGFAAVAYEVKVSRADFKRDSHEKQRQSRLFSDRFYYATPPGLVSREEVPDWAGLVEIDGGKLVRRVPAPLRDKDAPTWQFVVSLIRNSGEIRRDADRIAAERNNLRRIVKDAEQKLREAGLEPWRFGVYA